MKDILRFFFICTTVLFFSSFSAGNPSEKSTASYRPNVKVKQRFLPASCSRERIEDTEISHIMLHFCSYVEKNPSNPYRVWDILNLFKRFHVSAHYLIDRNGIVYQLVNEKRAAHHAGRGHLIHEPDHFNDLNDRSIGIEMMAIGTQDEMSSYLTPEEYKRLNKEDIGYTDAQYRALVDLLNDIKTRHSIPHSRKFIVGHDEYAHGRRTDPGFLFDWSKIGLQY